MRNREIIESVGLELEFSKVNRKDKGFVNDLREVLPGFNSKHDASCETPVVTFAGIPVKDAKESENVAPFLKSAVIGGELASPIINSNSPDWVNSIHSLCQLLKDHGEVEDTKRDSFHVHVNVSSEVPLYVLKNLLKLISAYESVIFRLGGLGRVNRGEVNNFCYQRPFLGNGPPIVRHGDYLYPILDVDDLLAAQTRKDFFNRYGCSVMLAHDGTRYVTQRYMVANFYSILMLGSFEFRTANKTLNPEYMIAWTNFCKAFVEKAWTDKELNDIDDFNPLYANEDLSTGYFLELMEKLGDFDSDTIDTFLEIWELSPTPHFDNVPRFSHLRNPTGWSNHIEYLPDRVDEEVFKPEFTDIHHLEDEEVRHRNMGRGIVNNPPRVAVDGRLEERLREAEDNNNDPNPAPGMIRLRGRLLTLSRPLVSNEFLENTWFGPIRYTTPEGDWTFFVNKRDQNTLRIEWMYEDMSDVITYEGRTIEFSEFIDHVIERIENDNWERR